MEQLGSHWTDFYEILFFVGGRGGVGKYIEKIRVLLNYDKNNGYSTQLKLN
jgi:hypothetical protein